MAFHTEEVLKKDYKPSTPEQDDLFKEKNRFMYSVFQETLQTEMGRTIVHTHEDDQNAQAVWAELDAYMSESTYARQEASTLLSYITTVRMGESWKGSSTGFILHWREKVRLYETMVDADQKLSDSLKLTLLQNAVSDLSELRMVKMQDEQGQSKGEAPLKYEQYLPLLLSAATTYDQGRDIRPKSRYNLRRQSNIHEFDGAYDYADASDEPYDLDTNVSHIQANVHDVSGRQGSNNHFQSKASFAPRANMRKTQWQMLPEPDKKVWDQLTQYAKAIVLEKDNPDSYKSSSDKRAANLAETAANFLVALHDQQQQPESTAETDVYYDAQDGVDTMGTDQNDAEGGGKTLLAHITKQKEAAPADIRRVLSSSIKRTCETGTGNCTSTVQTASTMPQKGTRFQETPDELEVNGVKYSK